VYDAELVNEPVYYRPKVGRFAAWWLRSPRVPMWLKSRAQARQAVKDGLAAVARSPLRYLGAVVRGLVAAARWWRRWVTVRDYREAAELSEKLADKFTEIRALTLFRWKVTGAVTAIVVLGVAIADLVYGARAL
jgi:DNA segregation ATPase FtsK/SpoIIIE, S-DNA-T family